MNSSGVDSKVHKWGKCDVGITRDEALAVMEKAADAFVVNRPPWLPDPANPELQEQDLPNYKPVEWTI